MRKHILTALFLLVSGLFLNATDVAAQTEKRVRFARGANSAIVKGRIVGYDYVDYILGIRGGQTISARLTTAGNAEIVVFDPAGENVGGDSRDFSAQADGSGDYKIRVLMPRAFARRNAASAYTLRISIR